MVYQNPNYQLFMPTVGQDYAGLSDLVHILNRPHVESGNTMITVTHDVRCAATFRGTPDGVPFWAILITL